MKIQFTVDAEKDIEEISCHSVSNFGETQAELYYSGLTEHLTYIAGKSDTDSNYSFVKENVFRSNFESHAIYYRQEKRNSNFTSIASAYGSSQTHVINDHVNHVTLFIV